MKQGHGNERNAQEFDRILRELQSDTGHGAERWLVVEDVGKNAADDSKRFLVAVDRKRRALADIEGANIVETENVVGVAVREKNCVEAIESDAEGLLAEVGGGVDDHVLAVAGDEQGRAEAFVVRVVRMANAAGA